MSAGCSTGAADKASSSGRRRAWPRFIAETARLRRDSTVIDHETDLVRNLTVLTGHRADLIADRVRMINRLRDLMTSVFPSLEREFDYSACKGALVLLTGYASPDRIRRAGQSRLAGWLRARKVRDSAGVAARAVDAAKAQAIALPGQDITVGIITELATSILALDKRLKSLDARIEELFGQHPQAAVITSMPGFGSFLGACLLASAGDLRAFPSAGHLAAAAGRTEPGPQHHRRSLKQLDNIIEIPNGRRSAGIRPRPGAH
ncbi:transposase [Nocardia sp. NPDC051750]|uniref:IS110 family transposase n=1 Tax=Nocardia sp. NPDC051750 TaxID=3364325 RepID=UPI0037A1B069